MKKFQRIKQQATEAFGRGDKSDKLTTKLAEIEKKVEGIRSGCHVTTKKLSATIQGSGSTLEKHQRKLAQFTLGQSMMEHGTTLGKESLFGNLLMMAGQAQQDIASQMARYEVSINQDVVTAMNTMIEEDLKKVDKCKKKLSKARLDMDSAKNRLRSFEAQSEKSTREYNMEKLSTLRTEVDEAIRNFEDTQDSYATEMYEFLAKEQKYAEKIQQLVILQITHYKNAGAQLESMLDTFTKRINEAPDRPIFGLDLEEHLKVKKCEIAIVLEACCTALRENWMDTEGLFRIAASSAKVKLLKSALDAGQRDLSPHDPHTIAGCMKMYLRELPRPLLTYELQSEWLQAAGIGNTDDRLQALWSLSRKLPKANFDNLQYLVGFLHEFAQYHEVTKMNYSNIAIVIGPNLLWPEVESTDAAGLVTDTALQRRIAEELVEHCHWFFPDLPETPPPVFSNTTKHAPVSPTSSFSSYTSSYTRTPDRASYGSDHEVVPLSIHSTREKEPEVEKEREPDLPHPLADNAFDEGITVHMVEDEKESEENKEPQVKPSETPPVKSSETPPVKSSEPPPVPSSPKPPVRPKPSLNNSSPVPKPRTTAPAPPVARTPSGELPPEKPPRQHQTASQNGEVEKERPTPPVRTKRTQSNTPTSSPRSGTLERKTTGGRGPQRRAPPPPVSRRAAPNPPPPSPIQPKDDDESLTAL